MSEWLSTGVPELGDPYPVPDDGLDGIIRKGRGSPGTTHSLQWACLQWAARVSIPAPWD